jgi:outer membrane PBP1 activator LpoA protein
MLPFSLFMRMLIILGLLHTSFVMANPFSTSSPLASPYAMPAATCLALAENQSGSEKQLLEVRAAGRLIYDGQWQDGLNILSTLKPSAPELIGEKHLLLAKVNLMRNQAKSAIAELAAIHSLDSMPLFYQVQYHEMLATAYRASGNVMEALHERMKLENLLPDESTRFNNRRALWLMLTTLPIEELNAFAIESKDGKALTGWIQLAVIARDNPADPRDTLARLQQWKSRYPNHPGQLILPAQLEAPLFASPQKIALLLPLTGKLSGPGTAVRDGFMQSYDASKSSGHLSIQFYDTDKNDVLALYQQAVAEGADYVVGPLGKSEVASIASIPHPVPTVLLNDIAQGVGRNAYQFGLSPVNEARQVAVRARKNGHVRTLVIAPVGSWGDEVSAAYTRQWQAVGGQVVDTLRYSDQQDLAPAIKQLLHAVEMKRPERGHARVDESKVSIGSRRRQDFDMIFLLAYPSKARQIMPMLRYYFAGDVPVYATSSVYSGNANPQKDRDLDGIIFCDIPWVFNHQMGNKNWPEQWNSYNRLYALGMDSFALVTQLNQLMIFPAIGVGDNNGALYLNAHQQITRILTWGKMSQGLAQEVAGG